MKKLVLELTEDQFNRIETVANLAASKPEHVTLAVALQALDSDDNWGEAEQSVCHAVDFYVEGGEASDKRPGRRVEDGAPDRRLRFAQPRAAKAGATSSASVQPERARPSR